MTRQTRPIVSRLLITLTVFLVTPGEGQASGVFIRGDANSDGVVELTDATVILGVLFRGDGKLDCFDAADANDDGSIDMTDAIVVLDFLFLGGPPPVGGVEAQADRTQDGLGCETPASPGDLPPISADAPLESSAGAPRAARDVSIGKVALPEAKAAASKSKPDPSHASSATNPLGINPCLVAPAGPMLVDRIRAVPSIDPTTCLDLTPKVALVRVSDLPDEIRLALPSVSNAEQVGIEHWTEADHCAPVPYSLLKEISPEILTQREPEAVDERVARVAAAPLGKQSTGVRAAGGGAALTRAASVDRSVVQTTAVRNVARTLTSSETELSSASADDWMLLYVPPTDSDGRRRITLVGDAGCDPDPCVAEVTCGKPTEEKCGAPDPWSCATSISLPGGGCIPLWRRSIRVQLTEDGPAEVRAYRGVIVAAGEITVSGPVRTNGTDLVLLAQTLRGTNNPEVDVTALRQPIESGSVPGGTLVVLADTIDSPGGLTLTTNGASGGLPQSAGAHPDCAEPEIDQNGNPECFPCALIGEGGDTCDPSDNKYMFDTWENRCMTHTEESFTNEGAHVISYKHDYQLPASFGTVAPSGGDGGIPGEIHLLYRTTNAGLWLNRGGGQGSAGLDGYRLYSLKPNACPSGTLDCHVDQTGSRWTVPDGQDGATPESFGDYYDPSDPSPVSGGSNVTLTTNTVVDTALKPVETRTAGRASPVETGGDTPVGGGDSPGRVVYKVALDVFKKISVPVDPWVARLIVQVSQEFVVAEEYLYRADETYRVDDVLETLTSYRRALEFLGEWDDYPCPTLHRYRTLRGEAQARLIQLQAGLDYMGRAADWAPHTPPDSLESLVLSKLQHATAVAIDLKLNALVSMASAEQQAAIAEALNAADGEMAQLEQTVVEAHLKEKQARVDELTVYVAQAEAEIPIIEAELMAYWQSLSDPPEGMFEAIGEVVSKVFGFVSKVKDVVVNSSLSSFGGIAGTAGAVVGAVQAGVAAYEAIDTLSGKMGEEGSNCDTDSTCQSLKAKLGQAKLGLYAARRALQAGLYALEAEVATGELFEARREAFRDTVSTLQQNQFELRSFDKVARAGQALCRYGRLLIDDAASDLFMLKRAAALWDVPSPLADAGPYDGEGANYGYDFNQLLDGNCEASDCTLWGEYNQFLSERLNHVVPNATTLYLGTATDGVAAPVAGLFHHSVMLERADEDGAAYTEHRAEVHLGLFETSTETLFGVRPTLRALQQGAPNGPPLLNAVDFEYRGAIQVHGIQVWGKTTQGDPLRMDFPFRISRPSTERYVTELTPPGELVADVAIPVGRSLDDGQLLDELQHDILSGRFVYEPCCDTVVNPVARPESLRKPWTLWVPICADGESPSQVCASMAELQDIAELQIVIDVRYRELSP